MDRSKNFKNWIAHWEAVRDLAAKDGDYPKWEAAEREIKNYSEFCPIEIDRRPSESDTVSRRLAALERIAK